MRRKLGILGILVGLLLLTAPVLAGGWAVITLDSLPDDVSAGETLSIGFMVRQHGQTPTNGVAPTLSAHNPATGERFTVDARQSGETGHFVVDVVFPSEGQWEWSLSGLGPPVQFAALTVAPATVAGTATATAAVPILDTVRWAALALIFIAGVMAIFAVRERDAMGAAVTGD